MLPDWISPGPERRQAGEHGVYIELGAFDGEWCVKVWRCAWARLKILALLAAVLLALSLWELAQRYFILSPSYQTGKTPQDYGVAFKEDWSPVPQAEGGGLVHAWWSPAESPIAPAVLFCTATTARCTPISI